MSAPPAPPVGGSPYVLLIVAFTGLALILAGLYTLMPSASNALVAAENEEGGNAAEEEEDEQQEHAAAEEEEEMPEGLSKREKKKWLKAQAKKKAAAAREADSNARLSKQAARDAKYRKRDEEREAREREEEKKEAAAEEEREAVEAAEFDEWKTMFSVDGEGETAAAADEASLLTKFETLIKSRKVVILEDLAADFKMSGQAVRERLEALIEMKRLDGVLDDRGKFIYITPEEFDAVAAYVHEQGRISVSALAAASNSLVRLTPDEAAVAALEMDAVEADDDEAAGAADGVQAK